MMFHLNHFTILLFVHSLKFGMSNLLMISITSGPTNIRLRDAIRSSWVQLCRQSPVCDHRFFLDTPKVTRDLEEESDKHGDMVFRNECDLMTRHPDAINYSNSPPTTKNLMNSSDYKFRRVYKVDWKVCFLRWSQRNEKVYEYHAFVEDDSFVCVGNLLHQVSLLSSIKPFSPFRTGTPMFDGFDDSSTFMSGEVAEIFAKYYPKDGFNCSVIVDSTDEDRLTKAQWLSWGNSWMSTNCAWRDNMFTSFHFNITEPKINCLQSVFKDKRVNVTALGIAHNPSTYAHSIHYPCQEHPIIFHHGKAGEILLRDKGSDKLRHLCEYMLLVDKIKDPKVMLTLHTEASAHNYRDFTPIFTHDSEEGWVYLLRAFEAEEQACAAVEGPPSPHCQQLRARRLAQNEDTAVRIAGKASQGAQLGFGLGSRAEPPPLREERENTLPAREDPGYRAYFGAVAVALDLDGT